MAVESAADRAVFVDADDFGEAATYTLKNGAARATVNGIFSNDYVDVAQVEGSRQASRRCRFTCREADIPARAGNGDHVTIGGDEYRVRVIEPDGTGMADLVMVRV